MQTFDLAEVHSFAAGLDARIQQCDDGEGRECANIDDSLRNYAVLCHEFCERVRQWGRAIFSGEAASDPEVERFWFDQGVSLYRRATALWEYGQKSQGECFVLEGGAMLGSALWRLGLLLNGWVTPKKAVAPLARLGTARNPQEAIEIQKRIGALAPLPTDWQPSDPLQQARLRKMLRGRPT